MKKLFAMLLALCMMGGVVAVAESPSVTLDAGPFSFVFPQGSDVYIGETYAEETYVTLTFDETTGEPYEKEMRYGGAEVYCDEWITIVTNYVDELPMEYSIPGTIHRDWIYGTATSEAEAAFYCQIDPQANWRYNIPVKKLADVGMFNMKPVYFAVYDIGFDMTDGTSYYQWRIDMVFYYEGCILTCSLRTDQETHPYELSEAEIEEYFDLLSSLMQCVRPAGMTDDELAALQAQQKAAQEELRAAIIGVWNVDVKAMYVSLFGLTEDVADMLVKLSGTSQTVTFTADHKYILTMTTNDGVTTEEHSYELINSTLVVDGGIAENLLHFENDVLTMYEVGLPIRMTRADADEAAADSPTTPAQPEAQSNWTVPTDTEQAEEPAEPAEPVEPTEPAVIGYITITDGANIRTAPDGSATKVKTAYKGEVYPLLGEEGSWYKILVDDQVAYVVKGLAKIK